MRGDISMTCSVCGKEIPSIFECDFEEQAAYFQMENGEIVCTDRECRLEHMKENAAAEWKDNYFANAAAAGLSGLAELATNGLDAMLDCYESGNTFELVNETYCQPCYVW
jgi:ferredoxin